MNSQRIYRVVLLSAWRDAKRFSSFLLLFALILATYHAVRFHYGNYRDLFTYHSTEGPFRTVKGADGALWPGAAAQTFAPGEMISWFSTYCLAPGAEARIVRQLYRVQPSPQTEVGEPVELRIRRDQSRCGRVPGFHPTAATYGEGVYELNRKVFFREGTWWPLAIEIPSIMIIMQHGALD